MLSICQVIIPGNPLTFIVRMGGGGSNRGSYFILVFAFGNFIIIIIIFWETTKLANFNFGFGQKQIITELNIINIPYLLEKQ